MKLFKINHLFLQFNLLFIGLASSAYSQTVPAILESTTKFEAEKFIGKDTADHYYFANNNIFSKKNAQKIWQYKNLPLGEITKIDLSNPLNIVLFYENFNTVVLLDNQLNETQKINFSENNTPIVAQAVGLASQNRLWIYNNLTQQIGLFDYLKNSYTNLSTSFKGQMTYYESDFNSFYWTDDARFWYSCSIFGIIDELGQLPIYTEMIYLNSEISIYLKDGILQLFHRKSNKTYSITNVDKSFKKIVYKDQILSIFTNSEIKNYKIILP